MKKLVVLFAIFAFAASAVAAGLGGEGTDDIKPYVIMYPGDYYSAGSYLYSYWPLERDYWYFINIGQGDFSIEVDAGDYAGDTMFGYLVWYAHGVVDWDWASYPDTFTLESYVTPPGNIFTVVTAFLHETGTYPAYYSIEASFN